MTIFIVCSRLCAGGAERVGVVLANGFAEKGHEVFLLSNTNLDIAYPISTSVHVVNIFPNTTNKFKKWIGAVAQLREEIKRHHPDVVIGIEETCSLMAKLASVGQRIHVICTEHNSYQRPPSAPMGRMEWFMKYQMTKIYECVTVLTDADRDYIGSRLNNVVVMPNPLAIQPVENIPDKKKVLLAAGRLDVWYTKGFDLLIKAWGLIKGENAAGQREKCKSDDVACKMKDEGWRLQIAGTGSEESLRFLKQLCKENGVEDSVDFLGFRKDIEDLYRQSEIFVLSSRNEGFGLVLIEAMSQGCACVACDYNGRQREIIQDDSQGLCCEPDDVEALANSIKKMIEDEEYRKEVQRNSVERSKTYSADRIVQRWENLFDQMIY